MTSHSLLVTGVSGHLGRLAAHHLLLDRPQGVSLRGCTRTPDRAAALAERGMAVIAADFDDPASLDRAVGGVDGLLLVSTGAEHAGPVRVRQHLAALAAARRAGVGHVVYTSLQCADDSPLRALVADHAATEAALPPRHTVLRNAFYMEMVLATLPPAIRSGRFVTAAGAGRIAYVARADCARVAAQALRRPDDAPPRLEVTGAESFDAYALVEVANAVLGTSIVVEAVPPDELAARLVAGGQPPALAAVLAGLDRGVAAGAMAAVHGDVAAFTGTPPIPLAGFLAAHRGVLTG
jgi:NAD(P)H dehydrogenase (quinone)